MRIESPEREWMFAKGVAKIGNASCIVVVDETQEIIAGKARFKAIRGDLTAVKKIHRYEVPTDAGTVSLGLYCDGRREAWLVRFIKNDDSLIKAIQFASNWKNPDDYDWEKIVEAVRLLHGKGWKLEELGMSDIHTKQFIDATNFSASKIQEATENEDIQELLFGVLE
tara:strand:- start:6275 stop:6778 length:504 start_codon:yes stop_codon:yes gene_type:complete